MTEAKKSAKTSAAKRSAPVPEKKAAPAKVPAKAAKLVAPKLPAGKVAPAKAKPAPKAKAPATGRKRKPAASAEQRRNYVEIAAYYIAERRGFAPGDPLQDWIAAEAEIDRLLREGLLGG